MLRRVGVVIAIVAASAAAVAAATHRHRHHKHRPTPKAKATTSAKAATSTKAATRARETGDAKGDVVTKGGTFEMPPDASTLPAVRYGALSADDCTAQLTARGIAFARETAIGVAQPVRLTGPLHGVTFEASVAARDRGTTPHGISDCRLLLALDDFAGLLAQHDIVHVQHYSMYRAPPAPWPADQIATRHPGGLAVDVARFTKRDGTVLTVLDDFHGALGDTACDGTAPHPATPAAIELRAILCDTVARRLFNVVLTPDYDEPHKNHFHLEVTAGVKWFLVH
jgi:hypothetical protein